MRPYITVTSWYVDMWIDFSLLIILAFNEENDSLQETKETGVYLALEYLWLSWRQGGRAGRYQAEMGCGCEEQASAGLWISHAGRLLAGWR